MNQTATSPAELNEDTTIVESAPNVALARIAVPANWFVGLSIAAKTKIRSVQVADLKLHAACDFLPFSPRACEMIVKSVNEHGVLYPLAVAANGKVIDGRYRLRAAQKLGPKTLPVLTIDIDGDSVVSWIFHIKYDREHLTEGERLVLAHQYQQRLSGEYKKFAPAR